LLLAFFLDFPAQEKQPILVPLSLSLQRVLPRRERGGAEADQTPLGIERECAYVFSSERGLFWYISFHSRVFLQLRPSVLPIYEW
jgi:hypothetical protein